MSNSMRPVNQDEARVILDAHTIGCMIKDNRYNETETLQKAQVYIAEQIQSAKKEPLDLLEQNYIKSLVNHGYKKMKYESRAQTVLNVGKTLLIGAIAAVPATFIYAEIHYENKEENLATRQKELETRLAHNKTETPIVSKDQEGDVVVTQGNTQQMLAQTKRELTTLHEHGRTITEIEKHDGLMAGGVVAAIAIGLVHRAWRKTARRIGEACAARTAPLPQSPVPLPK